jgi:hypothetical protein
MKKQFLTTAVCLMFIMGAFAQNAGIGTGTGGSLRAKLEVHGVAGSGATNAIFGGAGNAGISLQQNWPTIGFNQYRDIITPGSSGKYATTGYASLFTFDYTTGSAGIEMFGHRSANSFTGAGKSALHVNNVGNIGIGTPALSDASLWVRRTTGNLAAASISGNTHIDQFMYGNKEDVYIRGGLNASRVVINDIPSNKVMIGIDANLSSSLNIYGSVSYSVTEVSANYTIADNDRFIICNLNRDKTRKIYISLPTPNAGMEGRVYTIIGIGIPNLTAPELASVNGGFAEVIGGAVGDRNIYNPQIIPGTGNSQYYRLFCITKKPTTGAPNYDARRSTISVTCINGLWVKTDEDFQFDSEDVQ